MFQIVVVAMIAVVLGATIGYVMAALAGAAKRDE